MAAPLSPDWWLDRLYGQLRDRQGALDEFDAWYAGPQPAPRGYAKARELLKEFHDEANANFSALLVDAAVELMHVEGFKVDGKIDDDIWEVWQSNSLDLGSEQVFLDRLALGEASMLVSPEPNADGLPTITPEHPKQTIVAYLPGNMRERAAGLKVWVDDLLAEPMLMATVYLAQEIVTYQAPYKPTEVSAVQKPEWELQASLSGPHDLGEVPLVAFPNRPRMMNASMPEFYRTLPIQRRINRTILDRLTLQHAGAFKQKWVSGLDVPVDPDTGKAIEPFKSAVDRLFVAPDPETKFGQFEPEDIGSLLKAVAEDVKHMAALVPTPPHYLLGELVNIGGEALKAAQSALISRVRMHHRHVEDPQESVARLAARARGKDAPKYASMSTVWRNPEFRTEGELVDALVKMSTLGVPREALWERWGATPNEIQEWRGMQAAEAQRTNPLAGFDALVNPRANVDAGTAAG